jgi:acetyl-CoA/propionyl-CoA carboxylase, biotin carboxylase, biotin carboxyl carrier protein
MGTMKATRVADGVYRVELDGGRFETVYIAGRDGDRWAFWNGHVFRGDFDDAADAAAAARVRAKRSSGVQTIIAPMPATVLKVHAAAGDRVKKGDTLLVLEAMKMELPLRAAHDAVVRAVSCREGELVAADTVLVTLE